MQRTFGVVEKYTSLQDVYKKCAFNQTVLINTVRAWNILQKHDKACVCVSGGSDSDLLLDIIFKCDKREICTYVFIDTGLEFEATKRHIKELSEKYKVQIKVVKPKIPIPLSCKRKGIPFLDKITSEYMYRLQKHGFMWEDEPYEMLIKKYPKCQSALKWWCNENSKMLGRKSQIDISNRSYLKEFIIKNPPTFLISAKCCDDSKKKPNKNFIKSGDYDLLITGVRKAEGGARSINYKNCYDDNSCKFETSNYRPLFFYSDEDKEEYVEHNNIFHSDCYTVYGMIRTGCCGCPCAGKRRYKEIEIMEEFEPLLALAAKNVFGKSYEYMDQYYEFVKEIKNS